MVERTEQYLEVLRNYRAATVVATRDPDDKENLITHGWEDQHYADVGREALELVVAYLMLLDRAVPRSILDLPCGSGRVTRHLRAAFPDARIGASDLYEHHMEFCAATFGTESVPSSEDFDSAVVAPEWDVVFVGSLLTHLPERRWNAALRLIVRALSPTGIALITLEGRRSREIQRRFYPLIPDRQFRVIEAGYRARGFGFANYRSDMSVKFFKQRRYGVALVKPSYVMRQLERMPDVSILGYRERAWDNHQDLVVIGRPAPTGLDH